jgi:hypothetical protein
MITQTELMKSAFAELMKSVSTSIPGHILAFDPDTQLAQVQIGIVQRNIKKQEFTPAPIIEVPVYFCGGVNFSIEYEINHGDEGFILFSQRCIDGWMNTGGVAKNPIDRFHDLSDAAFLPGFRSQPKVLPSFENNGIRLRNDDGTHYVWLKNDGTIECLNSGGNITMAPDGTVNINGAIITPAGAISSPVSVTAPIVSGTSSLLAAGDEVVSHKHDKGTYKDAENRSLLSGDSGTL